MPTDAPRSATDRRAPEARSAFLRRLARLRAKLPQGGVLPAHLLERRHRTIVAVLIAHIPPCSSSA